MPEYDFRTLSPSDFELLVRDLLSAEHGWQLEAFGHGQDGGVDLRGWIRKKKLIVQCKHYVGSTFSDLRKTARQELLKMNKERPDRYLFATSQNLSRTQKDSLAEDLSRWLASPDDLLTQLDLNALLRKHSKVERQHFKLWLASTAVLERIVHNGLWERSEALMEDIRDRVKLYVRSPAYQRAIRVLDANHVVVLTGAPGVGKSMLAEMILLSHWHEDWQVVSLSSNIDEGWDAFRRNEKQIFVYDDFLGQTDISERASKNEDVRIVRFMDRVSVDPTKRLVMTTRSQILRQASLKREPIARGNFQVRECLVEIADYGPLERARILYNHLYFSKLPRQVLRDYVNGEHYWQVVNHSNFSPRVIEQVLKRDQPSAKALAESLVGAFDRPIELWGTMFATVLSNVAQRIVLALVSFPTDGIDVDILRQVTRREARPIDYTHALRALEGTFITIRPQRMRNVGPDVRYANPSVRDFVLATLDDEPEYALQILIEARLLQQVQTLLAYAVSTADGRYKFPRLARSISTNQDSISEHTISLVERVIQEAHAKKSPESHVHTNAIRPLAGLLDSARQLMPERFDNLFVRAMSLHREYEIGHPWASSLEALTRAFMEHMNERPEFSPNELGGLVYDWGRSIEGTDEIRDFIRFTETYRDKLRDHFDLDNIVTECVEIALREEIETMANNRTDEDADHSWLDEIESIARSVGVDDRLAREIESERSSTAEYYSDEEDIRPASGWHGNSSTSNQVSIDDRLHIDGIFRHLL